MSLATQIRYTRIKLGYRSINTDTSFFHFRKQGKRHRLSSTTIKKIKSSYSLVEVLNEERGYILGLATEVEQWVDNIIALFFFRNRYKQKNIRATFKFML